MSNWSLQVPLRRVEENPSGRDFVVGDVHGCVALLEQSLRSVEFDSHHDRLFSVGDLIDRGDGSVKLLEWLSEPWFFSCLGNHESILLDFVSRPEKELAVNWEKFGGSWFLELPPARQAEIARLISQYCSYAIVIEALSHDEQKEPHTAIVHADIPQGMDWPEFSRQITHDKVAQYECLWSRARGQGNRNDTIMGVNQVVTGHQIVKEAYLSGNVWLIDTGAYRGSQGQGALTILELPATVHRFRAD